jgi:hypothetical protein
MQPTAAPGHWTLHFVTAEEAGRLSVPIGTPYYFNGTHGSSLWELPKGAPVATDVTQGDDLHHATTFIMPRSCGNARRLARAID